MASSRPLVCRIDVPGEETSFLARPLSPGQPAMRIDGVVPGELVLARERVGGKGWAELIELLEPSSARRDAPCIYAGRCGGCHWQHIEAARQSELRLARLRWLLVQAGIPEPQEKSEHLPSPQELAYRYRARFQIAARTREQDRASANEDQPAVKGDASIEVLFGFHGLGTRAVVDTAHCPLLAPELAQAHNHVRGVLAKLAIPGLNGLELTALPGARGALCVLNPRDRAPEDWPACGEHLLEACGDALVSVTAQPERGTDEPLILGERSLLGRTPDGHPIAVAARGFLQANLAAADHLADAVTQLAEAAPGVRILELFAGSALLGWRLAATGATVHSIESDALAVEAGQRLPAPPRGHLHLEGGDALSLRTATLCETDVLVADPPRSGLGGLAETLATRGPERFVLVACSMSSLVRDLKVLCTGHYQLRRLLTADLFPQTRHLETVALLVR